MTTHMASSKPTLALQTPSTANFPKDVLRDIPSAVSVPTPSSTTSVLFSAGLPSAGLPSAGFAQTPTAPQSARIKEEKTPITPPLGYLDFLRSCSLASPPLTGGRSPINRKSLVGSTASNSSTAATDSSASASASDQDKGDADSAPSTATSEKTDFSCDGDSLAHKTPMMSAKLKSPGLYPVEAHPKVAPIDTTALPASPAAHGPRHPLSAPPLGVNFPSLNLPASPAYSNCGYMNSPRSPFSARSVQSPFDWDAALKSRRFSEVPTSAAASGVDPGSVPTTPKTPNVKGAGAGAGAAAAAGSKRNSRSTIRHIREVVTRTVTYTPRGGPTAKTPQVGPAPKGKRRKVDHETAVET